jgi:hypothetical protein
MYTLNQEREILNEIKSKFGSHGGSSNVIQ